MGTQASLRSGIGERERAAFLRDGFLSIARPFVGPRELARMRVAFDRLAERCPDDRWEEESPDGEVTRVRRILPSPHLHEAGLRDTAFHRAAQRIARQLLGAPSVLARSGGYYKPPRIGSSTPWHQDAAFFPADQPAFLIVWMPLVAVSVRSGCLSFIPGSHRRGLLPHHAHVAPDHPSLAVASGCVDPDEARACPLPAGGLSIYTSLTVHSAGPNLDRVRRRALILDYEALPRARRG